jgi:redox-sensitive bicupin YhaK (pirin superfamily)
VTVVREGKVDHYDSLGATARFGGGGSDTQWVTCGNGMAHSEMFPLINSDKPNPMVLFQLWLNLPAASKKSDPYFTMLWSEKNPVLRGPGSTVTVIADEAKQFSAAVQSPPPDSFASKAGSNVAIVLIELAPGGEFTLPATAAGTNRKLFYYSGPAETTVAGVAIKKLHGAKLDPTAEVLVSNAHGTEEAKYLLLQGKPIGEPVVQQGPFVTNDRAEMAQVYARYQRTQFGGWPWESNDPAHPLTTPRFARHPDGREEFPDQFKE